MLSISGKYESLVLWEQSLHKLADLDHFPTQQYMKFFKLLFKYRTGQNLSIMETQKIVDEIQIPTLKAMAKIYCGIAWIEMSKVKEDQLGGLQTALSAGQEIEQIWGEENGHLFTDSLTLVIPTSP